MDVTVITLLVPILTLAIGTFGTRFLGVWMRSRGRNVSAELDHYSHLASLTLLFAVVATSSFSKEDGINLPVLVAILLAGVLAYFKRSLLLIVVLSAAAAALSRFLLNIL